MNVTLRQEDRRAVDLILDRTAEAASGGFAGAGYSAAYGMGDASLGERLMQAQKLFKLLEQLPGDEPPADLLKRTIRFIEKSSLGQAAPHESVPTLLASDRPHA